MNNFTGNIDFLTGDNVINGLYSQDGFIHEMGQIINKEEKVRKSMKKHYEYYFAKCEDILCYIKIRERENHLLKIINVIIFLNKPCHNQEVNFKSYKEQYKILV